MDLFQPITAEEKKERSEVVTSKGAKKVYKCIAAGGVVHIRTRKPNDFSLNFFPFAVENPECITDMWSYVKALELFISEEKPIPAHYTNCSQLFDIELSDGSTVKIGKNS